MPACSPARLIPGDEAELDGSGTTARAEHGGGPRARWVANEVESSRCKNIGQVVDDLGGESGAESRPFD